LKTLIFFIIALFIFTGTCFAGMRIISLAPSVTEILYELGLEDNIVAVTSYCDYPERVKEKQIIGDFSHPSLEKIISLNPDIIFNTGIEQKDIATKLKIAGMQVETVQPDNISQLYKSIERIGSITKTSSQAEELINRLKQDINRIQQKVNKISANKRVSVFILLWHDPLLTAGSNSFVNDIIELAGGVNIAGELIYPYSRYNLELLIKNNPDYIVVAAMENQIDKNYIEKISKLTDSKIISGIDPDIILRPSPRVTEAINIIYKRLYEQ